MISDERLREAARKVEESMLASLPEPEECEATFSPEFERKMKKLIRRTDHPIRHRIIKAVACFLLVVLVGGGSVLTFSVEARAAFIGWMRETYESWFVYRYVGADNKSTEGTLFYPTWLPDGYYEKTSTDSDNRVRIVYENSEGDILTFFCTRNKDSVNLYFEQDKTDMETVLIGNIYADLYLDKRENESNTLIWDDAENGLFFWISAHCGREELIMIAESVYKN